MLNLFANIKKFFANKKNRALSSEKEFLSLAPNYEIEGLDDYEKIIDNCLKERRLKSRKRLFSEFNEYKNRNIAITGDFGSGKSSVINSFFAKHGEYHTITVSMGLYNKSYLGDVYNYILKQILYTVRPNKLPFSRYYRTDRPAWMFYLTNFLIVFTLSLVVLFFMFPEILLNITFIIILFSLIFIDILLLLNSHIFNKMNISLSSPAGSVEITTSSPTDVLNSNLEELIHFFMSTKYSIIVFEDLDRRDDYLKIVKALSLINYTINNSLVGRTIQFIYAISDRCFDDMETRTKFFDCIIPIKPYLNGFNSFNIMKNYLHNVNFDERDECIYFAVQYLNNPRLIFDFVNEYRIFYNSKATSAAKCELFYLILYKVAFPSRFYKFMRKESEFSLYYSHEFEKYIFDSLTDFLVNIPIEQRICKLSEFSKRYKVLELNDFEEKLIKSDKITKNYERVFIRRNEFNDKIDEHDERLIERIKKNEDIKGYVFNNVSAVCDCLNIADFQNDSVLNVKLLAYALEKKPAYISQLLNTLNINKVKYLVANERKLNILYRFNKFNDKFWAVINHMPNGSSAPTKTVNDLLFYTLKYCDLSYIQSENSPVIAYLSNNNSYYGLFNDNYAEIADKFHQIKYALRDDLSLKKGFPYVTKEMFITGKCKITSANIKIVDSEFGLCLYDKNIIGAIKNIKDKEISEYIISKIDEVLNVCLEDTKKIFFTGEELSWLIDNSSISAETVRKLIDLLSEGIDDLTIFVDKKDYFRYIVLTSKFDFSLSNVEIIYNNEINLIIENKKYFVDNGVKIFADYKNGNSFIPYFVDNILVDLDYDIFIKYLLEFVKHKLMNYVRTIINNNSNLITLENYTDIMKYDNQLNFILGGHRRISASYKNVVTRLYDLNILSSRPEINGNYYRINVKKMYQKRIDKVNS